MERDSEYKRRIDKAGILPHEPPQCQGGDDCYRGDRVAVRVDYCECNEEGEYGDDDGIPVTFPDGVTCEVSEERARNCISIIRGDHARDNGWYRKDTTLLGAAAIVAVELRAANCDEARRLGELQRVVRDAAALLSEFACSHARFCDCALCAFWSSADPAVGTAAEKASKAAEKTSILLIRLLKYIRAAAPDYRAYSRDGSTSFAHHPFDVLPNLSPEGVEASRERLAASMAYVNKHFVAVGNSFDRDPADMARWRAKCGFTPAKPKEPPVEPSEPVVPEAIAERMAGTLPEANGDGCNGHTANGTH